MVSKCANPQCSVVFRYLREGKLFQVPSGPSLAKVDPDETNEYTKPRSRDEFFWLCGACSQEFTIVLDHSGNVQTVTRRPSRAMRAAS